MTEEKMRKIIHSTPFDELEKNAGIYVFYEEGNLSIGVSYEDGEESEERYIYNIFADEDDYINIGGDLRGRYDDNIEPIISELVLRWNELKN